MARIAVIDRELCKPHDCYKECIRFCPIVRTGKNAIFLDEESKRPVIAENLCTGCGICVKKCPFKAITVVNLPDELEEECVHRYGENMFKLYRLPVLKEGRVLGLLGPNGVGKSTSIKILSGEIYPNLGRVEEAPSKEEVIRFFRGSELQPYFEKLFSGKIKVVVKPQYVEKIPRVISGRVRDLLERVDEAGRFKEVVELLELEKVLDREIKLLSGGELQRVAIAAVALRDVDVYMFDEPSSYLDVKQRLKAAKLIRRVASWSKTVVVAEHDLAVLDYMSDHVCILYGKPGVYGIVSKPHGVRNGINIYLEGYLPEENLKFRREPVKYFYTAREEAPLEERMASWGDLEKRLGDFTLQVRAGEIYRGEIIGILGPNGIGKTTMVKLLAGILEPDSGYVATQHLKISYKPQYIAPKTSKTVREVLEGLSEGILSDPWFKAEVFEPLTLEPLLDQPVDTLSGGELQRVAIAACIAQEAELYLFDEPSAHLDVEQRLAVARVIRRVTEKRRAATFVVEHDLIAMDLIADRLMVFSGEPGVKGMANPPTSLRKGMNQFLREVGITFRRDPSTGRPRANKEGSWLDRHQKEIGEYFYAVVSEEEGGEE